MNVRVATYNAENLFGRAKIFNFYRNDIIEGKLQIVGELQDELRKTVYDKKKIISLYKQVQDYIKFNVMHSSVGHKIIIYSKKTKKYTVKPSGSKDWFGFIEFKRDIFDDIVQKNITKVIKAVNADILCIIEVENRLVLKEFNSDRLKNMYKYNLVIDGNDPRQIDVGLYSKFPIANIRTNIFDGTPSSRTFSRDCLEVEVELPNGDSIKLLINHLKSKSGWDQKKNDARRLRQSKRVREILDNRYDLKKENVIVAGDLNDTSDRAPLKPLFSSELEDVLEMTYPELLNRWTYHYKEIQQIDYLMISIPLKSKLKKAGVERRGIANLYKFSKGNEKSFETVTNWRDQASDHGAVWADFEL